MTRAVAYVTPTTRRAVQKIIKADLAADPSSPVLVFARPVIRSSSSTSASAISTLRAYTRGLDLTLWTTRAGDFIEAYAAVPGFVRPPRSRQKPSGWDVTSRDRANASLARVVAADGNWVTVTSRLISTATTSPLDQIERRRRALQHAAAQAGVVVETKGHAGRRIETKVVSATKTVRLDARLLN